MRRWPFIAALLGMAGAAKAQTQAPAPNLEGLEGFKVEVGPDGILRNCSRCVTGIPAPTIGWKQGKAINNQCPMCGTMAKPYRRRTEKEVFGAETCIANSGIGSMVNSISNCVPPSDKLYDPKRIQVYGGCLHCGAAFWQDSEN